MSDTVSDAVNQWFMTIAAILLSIAVFRAVSQRDELKSEAVKRGFAEWVVNEKGDTTWKWKDGAK
jgi:hypothetical protein